MTRYIAYDDNAIYSVADTAEAAIAKAVAEAKNEEADFYTANCTDAAAMWIEKNGFNAMAMAFEVVDGRLAEITVRRGGEWVEVEF